MAKGSKCLIFELKTSRKLDFFRSEISCTVKGYPKNDYPAGASVCCN